MKRIFIIAIVFFLSTPFVSNGQTFSLQEMIILLNKNVDDFDTYVVTKGFKYAKTEDDIDFEGVQYALNQNEYSDKAQKFVTLYTKYFFYERNISYQTLESSDYLKIKSQIKVLGFKFVETRKVGNRTFLEYSKGKLELLLISIRDADEEGEFTTTYEIGLSKNP